MTLELEFELFEMMKIAIRYHCDKEVCRKLLRWVPLPKSDEDVKCWLQTGNKEIMTDSKAKQGTD